MALAICSLVRKIILAYQNFISINTRKPQKPILCADRSVTRSPFAGGITSRRCYGESTRGLPG